MNTLIWVATGVLGYWILVSVANQRGWLPEYVSTQGPITTIHTERGKAFLDRLAQRERFWRAWANLGLGIALVVMVGAFLMLGLSAVLALSSPQPSQVTQPRNVLAIPGVNDFLPLSMAPEIIFGLVVGLVVHEGGHGLLCRVEDIDIKSMGVALLAIIPMGAFVEPEEESQRNASRGGRTRMFAAGVTNNFVLSVFVFALLFGPVAGAMAVAPGASIAGPVPSSGAEAAGIDRGDRITAIDGEPIETNSDLEATLDETDQSAVTVELNGEEETTIERSLVVDGVTQGGPDNVDIGDRITAVGGESVVTQDELQTALAAEEVVTVTLERDGAEETATMATGTLVVVSEGGPLDEAGLEPESNTVITQIAGERTVTGEDLRDVMAEQSPGEAAEVVTYDGDERTTHQVTFVEADDGRALVGAASVAPGVNGITTDDWGLQYYPAGSYLEILGGESDGEPTVDPGVTDSFIGKTLLVLFLPVAAIVGSGVFPESFAGFTGELMNFYVLEGPLAVFGPGVFVLANVLFWVGWINIQLGFFNCIPAFPLDGGHILRTSTEAVVSRLPIEGSYQLTKTVTTTIGLTMLLSLLVVIFGPRLLA
ncbi:site-2 protease family protein [Natronoarchaeum sp. GCM10025703]|uniref:site-2 protease family protein n=1 Tax=unclassified Natronoarchaeum TaxID=2620183 RepID=UPI00361CB093